MEQKISSSNNDISVFSISAGYLMRMGKVKGMGIPSIFAFHREMVSRGFKVTFLQASPEGESDLETGYENLFVRQVRNFQLLGYFALSMDDFRIYSRALAEDEIHGLHDLGD